MSTTKNKVVKVVTFTLEYDADFPIPTNEDLYDEVRSVMHNSPPMFEGDDEKLVNWQCEVTDFVAPDAEEPVSLGEIGHDVLPPTIDGKILIQEMQKNGWFREKI